LEVKRKQPSTKGPPDMFVGHTFHAGQRLGIVSHAWHLPRIRFLAEDPLGLHGTHLLDVPAMGSDEAARWPSERAIHVASRLFFLGARDPAGLLRRERRIVASMRRAEWLARRRPGASSSR
jgi:hypothetical protein